MKNYCRLFLFLLSICYSGILNSQITGLYINEILASNTASDYDVPNSDYPDWIEIYNSTSVSLNVGGYYLTNERDNSKKWQISENTIIAANGYYSVWADNSNNVNHTNFDLDKDGGFIGLYTSDGIVADSFSFSLQIRDVSYGRIYNKSQSLVFFPVPTKGFVNGQKYCISISSRPFFLNHGGFFSGPQQIELTASSPEAEIRYTINGSEPDTSSAIYTGPILVSKTTAIRARIFEASAIPGEISTQTFFIDEEINLPVISIVTDSANFFDNKKGIYVTGTNGIRGSCDATIRNLNQDWERTVNVELYETDGSQGINQEAGIKIYGGCSRTRFPQKSLALYARNGYGKGSFEYQIFPDKNIFQFKSFILRSSADDQVGTFMRDALAQYISIGDMDLDIQAYRPAVVFFDGEYWGIHDIREKISEHYFESNYNLEKSTVNILQSNSSASYGSASGYTKILNFISANGLEEDDNYNYIKSQIDIDEFIDYEILHIYLAERDWPGNNIKYWNSGTKGHQRWRWICFDLDQTFTRTTANSLDDATSANGPAWPNPPWSTFLLRSLLSNTDFKNRFIQRYAFYMCTTFKPERLETIVGEFRQRLEPEIPRHVIRWGGQLDPDFNEWWTISPTFSSLDQWLGNVNNVIEFIRNRPYWALDQLKSRFGLKSMVELKINRNLTDAGSVMIYDRKVPQMEFTGSFYANIPILLKATSNAGYKFLYWKFEGDINKTDTSSEVSFSISANQEVTAVYEEYEWGKPLIIINEINYNSSDDHKTGDWIEIYNKQDNYTDLSGWKLKDSNEKNEYRFPPGTVIWPKGYITICEDINSLYSHFPYIMNCIGNTGFGLKNESEVVRLYDCSMVLIDSVHYFNTEPWPELADGKGYTLILTSSESDNDLAENWTAIPKGTPGRSNKEITGIFNNTLPERFKHELQQNFPNPCKSSTTISYSLASKGNVSIIVYDMFGRELLKVVNEYQIPDSYQTVINVESLPDGIYFYSMKIDGLFAGAKKIVVNH